MFIAHSLFQDDSSLNGSRHRGIRLALSDSDDSEKKTKMDNGSKKKEERRKISRKLAIG